LQGGFRRATGIENRYPFRAQQLQISVAIKERRCAAVEFG
jgi:hypothetical protein